MDNKKKLIIGGVIFLVVLVFAVLVFSGVFGKNEPATDEITTQEDIENKYLVTNQYTDEIAASAENNLPYLETDIENLFYTVSTDGAVKFYTFADNKFTEVEADGAYDVTVTMSEQEVKATVTYIEKDGVISGYGLYKGATDGFDLYPYAFFRLVNFGADNKAASGDYLLLVDTTADDFYSNDKIYDEAFGFKTSDSSCTRLLSEANRTVGMDGTKRSDYTLFNNAVIEVSTSHHIFFSGRQYSEADERVDLFRSGGTGNNVDNIIIARDVLGYWVKNTEDGLMYISVDENGNVIVAKYNADEDKSETVKTLDGVTREDILVDGDYIYSISKNTVYSILDENEATLGYAKNDVFAADMFTVLGGEFIVRGYADKHVPVTVVASLADGKVIAVYADEFFRNVVNPIVVSGGVMLTVQENDKFTYYIF